MSAISSLDQLQAQSIWEMSVRGSDDAKAPHLPLQMKKACNLLLKSALRQFAAFEIRSNSAAPVVPNNLC